MQISRVGLEGIHNELTNKAREIMRAKNQDYATEQDVFRNFRYFGGLGILVRMSDKLARLRSFEENDKFAVQDEKLVDTILDLVNYAIIYYAFKQEQAPEPLPTVVNISSYRDLVHCGPYCDFCEELADFAADDNSQYVCSNCAAEKELDTCNMSVLEQVA
jgi:hypothetical protein